MGTMVWLLLIPLVLLGLCFRVIGAFLFLVACVMGVLFLIFLPVALLPSPFGWITVDVGIMAILLRLVYRRVVRHRLRV